MMHELTLSNAHIPAMTEAAINKVYALEAANSQQPQIAIATSHLFHGGIYARTIMLRAGTLLTGALIKRATTLIISGDIFIFIGAKTQFLRGYNVLPASANRKQVFIALTDTNMTMFFPTKARTVEEAEEEFTDEAGLLFSHKPDAINETIITGE